jgi:hypothetical protein
MAADLKELGFGVTFGKFLRKSAVFESASEEER